jgi:DNA-binding CsgD family transcriptional regulator/tetratricopeptide (TPR) repeat protein
MEMAPRPVPIRRRASVSDAKLAYFEGDFDHCLEICADIRVVSIATASEVALLRARAFLRTGRPRDAQDAIADSLQTHTTLDATLTAQMLVAQARIRQDDPDTGIAILLDAATRADDAHFAVRSEIALCTALGYWAKRDIDTAETHLRDVDPRSDIIHARALELQAWCHMARRDSYSAALAFQATLRRLDDCLASDRAITATAISTLSILSAELFDREIARFAEARAAAIDWPSGLRTQRYLTLAYLAMFYEFAGDTIAAYQFAAKACESAPTPALEAACSALSSTIAQNAGELFTAVVHARRAQTLAAGLDTRELVGEERFALLGVAECCAHFDLPAAEELFARYWGLAPIDAMLALSGDPRLVGEETFISGVIAAAKGERDRAYTCYAKAFEIFRGIDYVRRAVIAGFAMLRIADDVDVRCYVTAQLSGTSNYISAALLAQTRAPLLERHPIVAALSPGQREIVSLICSGKTNREIAAIRNVSEQTIKNVLSKRVFPAFNVSSRSALVSACLRYGIRASTD